MRFDIEGFITFDTEEASLVNLLTGDCIELSATSTRLLTSLLQYRGDIISRVDIFQTVFEKYGARPSNSNLNQYISTLRRSLADLGIEKNVIITVPRIGFKISEDVIITTDNDYSSSITLPTLSPQLPERNLLQQHCKAAMLLIAFAAVAMLLSYFVGQKKYPIQYDLKSIGCYVLLATVLYVAAECVPIENICLRMTFRTLLLCLFIAYIIKRDLPLSQIPVINRFIRK